tara:strand:- start:166 stop:462 length:297 start_codon:yes stop_codon:yes gene_type:complete
MGFYSDKEIEEQEDISVLYKEAEKRYGSIKGATYDTTVSVRTHDEHGKEVWHYVVDFWDMLDSDTQVKVKTAIMSKLSSTLLEKYQNYAMIEGRKYEK